MAKNSAALVAVITFGVVLWLTPAWGVWSPIWMPVAIVAGYVVFLVLADYGTAGRDEINRSRPSATKCSTPQEHTGRQVSDAA
jgi:hypothetical protein